MSKNEQKYHPVTISKKFLNFVHRYAAVPKLEFMTFKI